MRFSLIVDTQTFFRNSQICKSHRILMQCWIFTGTLRYKLKHDSYESVHLLTSRISRRFLVTLRQINKSLSTCTCHNSCVFFSLYWVADETTKYSYKILTPWSMLALSIQFNMLMAYKKCATVAIRFLKRSVQYEMQGGFNLVFTWKPEYDPPRMWT